MNKPHTEKRHSTWMMRVLTLLIVCCCQPFTALASQPDTTAIRHLEKEMYRLFATLELDSFMQVTDRLKEEARAANDERLFYKTWGNQAIYLLNKQGGTQAMELMRQARDYAQAHNDKFGLYTSTYVSATIMSSLNLQEQAIENFEKAIDYQHRYFPDESAAAPYLGMAKIYWNQLRNDKVDWCAEQALKQPGIITQHQLTAWSYKCIALAKEDKYACQILPVDRVEFNRCFQERERVKAAYGHDDQLGEFVDYLYIVVNGTPEEALRAAKALENRKEKLLRVGQSYARLGNYEEAYLYARMFQTLTDSIRNTDARKQSAELAAQLDVARAESEATQLRTANQMMGLWMAIGATLLILTFVTFYAYRRRKQMRTLRDAYDRLEETTTEKERFESELRIARDIQLGMVPSVFPAFPDRSDIDLYALIEPAREVGGDLYDFFLQNDRLYFCIGDVSGKGVPAAMTMTVVVNLFRTFAKDGFPPAYIATRLNDTLSADNESATFVTMFIGEVDMQTGRLDYCNAGHNPPFIGNDNAVNTFRPLDVEPNAPIGLWPQLEFVGQSEDNIRDHLLVLYTDGITEAENRAQEQFGEKRLLHVLNETTQPFGERTAKSRSRYLVDTLKRAVEAHVDGAEPSDDLAVLCLHLR